MSRWEPSFLGRLTPGARVALAVVGALAGMALVLVGAGVLAGGEEPPGPPPTTVVVQGSN